MMITSVQDKFAEKEFWDKVAKQRVYAAFDEHEYNDIFDLVFGKNLLGKTIADIGSASGVSAALLASRGANVVGIEISSELVAQAKTLWEKYSDRIDFQIGDAENLYFDDNSIDAIFFGGVLHHIPFLDDVYQESFRVLKPGGIFLAIEPNKLDFLELIEWGIADLRGKLSPNEYPVDPYIEKNSLLDTGFQKVTFWTTRSDIPFLAQIPVLRLFFNRKKGYSIKRPILRFINAFREPSHRGTFIVLKALK